MDELRDRIVEAIHSMSGVSGFPLDMLHDDYTDTLEAQAQAVIDALGLHHIEGADGERRYTASKLTGEPDD